MAKKKGGNGAKADVLPPLEKDPEVAEKEDKVVGATAEERPSSPEEEKAPTPGGKRRKSRKVRKSRKGRKGRKTRK